MSGAHIPDAPPIIGLRRGIVALVPHQPGWGDLFAEEREVLRERIGQHVLDIQHVGSTAVPGLAAKPIIDIAIALSTLDLIALCREPLSELGYIDRGDQGADGGYLFVKERGRGVRTHHLHLVTIDDPQWRNYLHFRDTLRADAVIRARYGALKVGLQARFAHDRQGYTLAKDGFVRGVVSRS
jgi:GrpB-like predicted nucleotidyltransferase (UPF0157 family)